VNSVELLTQQTHFLSINSHPPNNDEVIIISNVGGPAIELTDRLSSRGFRLPQLPTNVSRDIVEMAPGVEPLNPVDLIADAGYERYRLVLERILNSTNPGAVIVIAALKSTLLTVEEVSRIVSLLNSSRKEGMAKIVYIPGVQDYLRVLPHLQGIKTDNVYLHHSSEVITEVLKNWHWYWRVRPPPE
ncbi:MAG: hypothetical protein J7L88_06645, partial [Thermoplasmata archaeon]|nr:hypothetical protein [Thermoplasmata archaeon]